MLALFFLMGAGVQSARAQPADQDLRQPAAARYDVVALRVAFQPDTTRFTTGDGTFAEGALFDTLRPSVDPLPHNTGYFRAHLDFLEDYVGRVSDGQTQVRTHLVPEVVQVSQKMAVYSPTGLDAGSDAEQQKLAALVEEAWQQAGQQSDFDTGRFDPERTAFVIFHAGVGRDLELVGTSLNKTPQDLPSRYFGAQALARLDHAPPAFNGLPVTNTLVMPRTETRVGFDNIEEQDFLAEYSINGLLAASFFNFLRVPDLFNTKTGETAIGPFGLMDPQGLFAYRGLFPPEPSAWTKRFLGWSTEQTLEGSDSLSVELAAASLPDRSDVAMAPISEAEYFLAENRNRDLEGDGLVLRVWRDGKVTEQHIQHGNEDFTRFNVDAFQGGVVVGVDNYDWALPGGVSEEGNQLNGGLLVWHIDERRLRAGLADNTVNADSARRAIDLEEADGAQDLGFPSESRFGPDANLGSPFDFFYQGNPVRVVTETGREIQLYENRFGPDTTPSSEANDGGPSFVVLGGFSEPGATMSLTYRRAEAAGIRPAALPFRLDERVETTAGSALNGYVGEGTLGLAFRAGRGRTILATPSRTLAEEQARALTPAIASNNTATTLAERESGQIVLQTFEDAEPPSTTRLDVPADAGIGGRNALLYYDASSDRYHALLAGGSQNVVARFAGDGSAFETIDAEGVSEPLTIASAGSGKVAAVGQEGTAVSGGSAQWSYALDAKARVGQAAFGRDESGLMGVVPLLEAGELLVLLEGGRTQRIDVAAYAEAAPGDSLARYPALVDLDRDGRLDVLTTYGGQLMAFTQGGALVEGFPIDVAAPVVTQPLVAELTDSSGWSVLVAAVDGSIYAYDLGRGGQSVPGFPLAVGERIVATPLLLGDRLFALPERGRLRAWTLDGLQRIAWGQLYGDAQNRSYTDIRAETPPTAPDRLLVAEQTYCWPNPIRNGRTNLRYEVTQPSRIEITIIDAAGARIDELTVESAPAGVPGEVAWQTDAESGLYFARVQATASDGTTETHLVKLAIIR